MGENDKEEGKERMTKREGKREGWRGEREGRRKAYKEKGGERERVTSERWEREGGEKKGVLER